MLSRSWVSVQRVVELCLRCVRVCAGYIAGACILVGITKRNSHATGVGGRCAEGFHRIIMDSMSHSSHILLNAADAVLPTMWQQLFACCTLVCALLLTMLCCAMLCYADLQAQAADRAADTGPGNAQAAAAAAAAWARQQWQQRWQQHGLGRGSGGCCSSSGSSWCGWQRYDSGSRSCASRDAAGSGAAAAAAGGVQQLHHCRCCSSNCVRSSCQPQFS